MTKLHSLWDKDEPPLMTPSEINLLVDSVRSMKTLDIAVELGCYAGKTSIIIASEIPIGARYIAVDSFVIDYSTVRDRAIKLFQKYPVIELIEKSTNDAAEMFNDPIDWLLVDADHQDHSIQEDSKNWLPKVRSGGLVAFHDYANSQFPSISKRVEESSAGWMIYDQVDSLMIKMKP